MTGQIDPNSSLRVRRRVLWMCGLVCLVFAAVASGFLVSKHFGGVLPGCGPQSGCDALERSPRSRWPLPFTGGMVWPVSFLGLAYFISMLAAWLLSKRSIDVALRVLATLGVLASLMFAVAMLYEWKFCRYCAVAHAANAAFVGALWCCVKLDGRLRATEKEHAVRRKQTQPVKRLPRRIPIAGIASVMMLVCFAAVSAGLGVQERASNIRKAGIAEAQRQESVDAIISRSTDAAAEQPVDRWGAAGFTGRYRRGPESATLRFVVLTDFQCPDCKRVESEIEAILKSRTDVSLSIKHFPMCVDCNKHVKTNMHPNACYAARAAEAAGILGGDEAFFKMADWLFEVEGVFIKSEDLAKGIERAGVSKDGFSAVMSGSETLKRIQSDVEDGIALGLYFTPMVFINGVEIKGWQLPGAIRKTVDQILAANPPPAPGTAASDRPPLAAQRFVDDWKESPALTLPADTRAWSSGAGEEYLPGENARNSRLVSIVVFGDYSEPTTAKFDAQLREAMKERPNVRYTFRHYPLNPECNPALPTTITKNVVRAPACIASRAAEAAGSVGGQEGYWKMHAWLMANQGLIIDEKLRAAAAELGLDKEKFAAALSSREAASAIAEDSRAGQQLGLTNIPWVYVNGKRVPRPMRDNDNVIKRIIEEASKSE
ncbi:MAG: thioredoxin domain-containing protein [Pyrinomonadaceae bacterium]|nr:thioredoxin domain-containing protein [Phycisphaerales bacterium]